MEIIKSGLAQIVVVTGWDKDRVAAALEDLPTRCVENPNWRSGMGTSIAAGVVALGVDVEGAFVVPADMPRLTSILFDRLAVVFDENGGQRVVFPMTASGAQRNPVLWPRRYFTRLAKLSGRQGAKKLLHSAGINRVAVSIDNTACFEDIHTLEDLQRATSKQAGASGRNTGLRWLQGSER
jgi:molybdenum cofactor cytidylyltransferase